MRLFAGLFALSLSISAFAAITPAQEEKVLRSIDMVCADTWCCGDYGFKFDSFKCDSARSSCRLDFEITEFLSESAPRAAFSTSKRRYSYSFEKSLMNKAYNVSCNIRRIKSYADLMDDDQHELLNDEFYDTLTECIGDLEKLIKDGRLP